MLIPDTSLSLLEEINKYFYLASMAALFLHSSSWVDHPDLAVFASSSFASGPGYWRASASSLFTRFCSP